VNGGRPLYLARLIRIVDVHLSELLNLKNKTRFGLRLELTLCVFGLLAVQLILLRVPPLDFLVTLLVVLYVAAAAKELKTRREPFTRRQKHVLFGLGVLVYSTVVVALLIASYVKRTPILWIAFGLAAMLSFVVLVAEFEQLYKNGNSD
jgi:hypothetical protein